MFTTIGNFLTSWHVKPKRYHKCRHRHFALPRTSNVIVCAASDIYHIYVTTFMRTICSADDQSQKNLIGTVSNASASVKPILN